VLCVVCVCVCVCVFVCVWWCTLSLSLSLSVCLLCSLWHSSHCSLTATLVLMFILFILSSLPQNRSLSFLLLLSHSSHSLLSHSSYPLHFTMLHTRTNTHTHAHNKRHRMAPQSPQSKETLAKRLAIYSTQSQQSHSHTAHRTPLIHWLYFMWVSIHTYIHTHMHACPVYVCVVLNAFKMSSQVFLTLLCVRWMNVRTYTYTLAVTDTGVDYLRALTLFEKMESIHIQAFISKKHGSSNSQKEKDNKKDNHDRDHKLDHELIRVARKSLRNIFGSYHNAALNEWHQILKAYRQNNVCVCVCVYVCVCLLLVMCSVIVCCVSSVCYIFSL